MAYAPQPAAYAPQPAVATALMTAPGLVDRMVGSFGEYLAQRKNPRMIMNQAAPAYAPMPGPSYAPAQAPGYYYKPKKHGKAYFPIYGDDDDRDGYGGGYGPGYGGPGYGGGGPGYGRDDNNGDGDHGGYSHQRRGYDNPPPNYGPSPSPQGNSQRHPWFLPRKG